MRFLPRRFVITYHERLIDLFGGSHGLRDAGLLESALAQPEASFDGVPLHTDLWEVAAAYAFHLIRNHPFVDGNKRIAAAAMGTCLEVNGAPLRVDEVELYQGIAALVSAAIGAEELAGWLREKAPRVQSEEG